jgi:hypothetical protein
MDNILICQKRRYKTEEEAQETIEKIQTLDDVKLSVYKCHTCHNYHLTSKQKKSKSYN